MFTSQKMISNGLYFLRVIPDGSRKIAPRKIASSPNSNAKPKPNPDPDRGAIFLGGNFPDTFLTFLPSQFCIMKLRNIYSKISWCIFQKKDSFILTFYSKWCSKNRFLLFENKSAENEQYRVVKSKMLLWRDLLYQICI